MYSTLTMYVRINDIIDSVVLKDTCSILRFFTAGNFGVVHIAYYTREDVQTKVAIKTLKGDH